MKFLKTGLSLAVIGATLSVVPSASSVAVGAVQAADEPSLERQMRNDADGTLRTSVEKATGRLGFVRATGASADLLPGVAGAGAGAAVAKATAYLDKYAAAFGATDEQLKRVDVDTSAVGTTVSFGQVHRGVPVFGSLLRAHLDRQGDLTSVNGVAVPVGNLSVAPRLDVKAAGAQAVKLVRAAPPTSHNHAAGAGHADDEPADVTGIRAKTSELFVYRNGLVRGVDGSTELVYRVEVTNNANIREIVFVSAQSGKLVNRYSLVHSALDREVYEQNPSTEPIWTEGDPVPGELNDQQENLVRASGESYYFFANAFGRDSYDDNGATMKTVNNDPRISCPNANWNGVTTNYCDGVTSDDVVAHEWGHAYTEYTWGGIYQWQPGALNEAYSDIWGETVDLLNGREDEGEGDITAKRAVGQCSTFTRGSVGATINSPEAVAGPCADATAAAFGPVFDKNGVTTDVVVGNDAANEAGPSTTDGCSPFDNAVALSGKFVYVDRGTCTFAAKTANAEAAGATGIVVGDNAPDRTPIAMSGDSDLYGVMVTQADGTRIKSVGTVNMTIKDIDEATKDPTSRWLIGEKSTAFGGAIRDMWNPTCYGHPGKVSDVEYSCSTDDAGGVHSNSGVPNHGFALLVDGGTYNDVTVPAIGHTKAAHIYFRAMTDYQTPTTDFADHADALEASCADLVGQTVTGLSTGGSPEDDNSLPALPDEAITAADCAAVPLMAQAVELRRAPTQCNFQPLLAKGSPELCGKDMKTSTVYSERFEDGLVGWSRDQEIADIGSYQGGFGAPWKHDESAPGGREGGVAYGPAPDRGECSGDGVTDFSSRDSIISPVVAMPARIPNAKLSFDHYVATEGGYDGGNVKISVNEGRFTVIDPAAYVFNPTNATISTLEEGNTNPLEGEPGFTGTDGGEVAGSWGTSIVNLRKAGIGPRDEVRFRFDIGRDGCGGVDGWYVDDVKVTTCSKGVGTTTRAMAPLARKFRRDFTVRAQVSKVTGGAAKGRVAVLHNGNVVGLGRLQEGRVAIPVRKDFRPGRVTLRARYLGNDNLRRSSDTTTTRIYR